MDRYVSGAIAGIWAGVVSAAVLFIAFGATSDDGDYTRGGLWSSLLGGVIAGLVLGLLIAHGFGRRR